MRNSIVVARDPGAQQLVLLFHGVGATAASLEPLGRVLARRFAPALIVSVAAPFKSDRGQGRQWFSVRGISESNRAARIAAAIPLFTDTVNHWQREAALAPEATTLLGFSQGAIMALEATQLPATPAGRVVAIAGRFTSAPQFAPPALAVHLIHGEDDPVIPSLRSVQAFEALTALGGRVTLDLVSGLGHVIDERVVERIVHRMRA